MTAAQTPLETMTAAQTPLVRIFECDPALIQDVAPDLAARLRRQVLTEVVAVRPGPFSPARLRDRSRFGLLILEGVLGSSVTIGGRRGVELFGEGDLIRAWVTEAATGSVPSTVTWSALSPTWVALLDEEFENVSMRCPGVMSELMDRTLGRNSLAESRALSKVRHIESRLLVILWQLADRWGHMEPGGAVLDLTLNQEVLAELVGAGRQSVNRAINLLARQGIIARRAGSWILRGAPPFQLESGTPKFLIDEIDAVTIDRDVPEPVAVPAGLPEPVAVPAGLPD